MTCSAVRFKPLTRRMAALLVLPTAAALAGVPQDDLIFTNGFDPAEPSIST